jgi:hypothetical protein
MLHCMSPVLAQSVGANASNLRQLLGEQRKRMDGRSRLPSTQMTRYGSRVGQNAVMHNAAFPRIW